MYQYLNDEPLSIFGDGLQERAFSFMDDCLEPFWKAATDDRASKQIINLGGTKAHTIKEASDLLIEVMGGGKVVYKEQRHEVKNAHPLCQKSVELLDYEDKTSLKEGLTVMWAWAKKQPRRERFVWPEYELDKGMYGFWKNPKK